MTTITKNGGIIYIRQNGTNIEYSSDETSWTTISTFPITINNTVSTLDLTISFETNINVTSPNFYFVCGSPRIIFNGKNNTFSFNNISSYPGLIQNGRPSLNGKNSITVQNIITTTTNSNLAVNAGWICQSYFSNGVIGLVRTCSNSGAINAAGSGGILGSNAGNNRGNVWVRNCVNSGAINGKGAGSATGSFAGSLSGVVTIQNFTNTITGIYGPNSSKGYAGSYSNVRIIEGEFTVQSDNLMFVSDVVVGTDVLTFNIIGTNLLYVDYVLINDIITPASFVINDDTSINFTLNEYIAVNSVKIFIELDYYIFSVIPPIFPICFPAGTPVLTDQGIINIEKINPKIHTIQNKKIVAVTQTITNEKHLVCIEKNALGNNIPSQQTIMSSNHCVVYKNKFIPARNLKNFIENKQDIYNIKYDNEILYNILMETHETINVNNMIVETLHPENIFAKLYYGKYSKKNIIFDLNDCMKHNNFKKCKQICNK